MFAAGRRLAPYLTDGNLDGGLPPALKLFHKIRMVSVERKGKKGFKSAKSGLIFKGRGFDTEKI